MPSTAVDDELFNDSMTLTMPYESNVMFCISGYAGHGSSGKLSGGSLVRAVLNTVLRQSAISFSGIGSPELSLSEISLK